MFKQLRFNASTIDEDVQQLGRSLECKVKIELSMRLQCETTPVHVVRSVGSRDVSLHTDSRTQTRCIARRAVVGMRCAAEFETRAFAGCFDVINEATRRGVVLTQDGPAFHISHGCVRPLRHRRRGLVLLNGRINGLGQL